MVGNTWNAKRNPCFSVSKKDPKRKSAPALLKSRIATNIFPKSWKPNLKYSRKETPNGFKIKNAKKFITKGDKVKFTVKFKGREMQHTELGKDLMNKIIEETKDIAKVESKPKFEGRQLVMIIQPL